jgi:hypothetical protein
MRRVWERHLILWGIVAVGLLTAVTVTAALSQRQSRPPAPAPADSAALARPAAPVVVRGDAFPAFAGAPLAELALYGFVDGVWTPLPFQVDEVDASGAYTTEEDARLDANDELVFMGGDAGARVSETVWISDTAAMQHGRYQIAVSDPLATDAVAWAYLYRSPTLTRTAARYTSWDHAAQTVTAVSYTLRFAPQEFLGVSDLTLNQNPLDVLDRQKLRGEGTIFLGPVELDTLFLTEASITQVVTTPFTVTLPISGPVRAIGGNETQRYAFYGQRIDAAASLDLSDQEIPQFPGATIHVEWVRFSLDWLNPISSGLAPATYFDSNLGTGTAVDGNPDAVADAPPVAWRQLSGDSGGVAAITAVDPAAGTLTNFYEDDDRVTTEDTGDGRSYGDFGFRIEEPNGMITVSQQLYILPGGTGNVGATYQAYAETPLTAVVSYHPAPGAARLSLYLPLVARP